MGSAAGGGQGGARTGKDERGGGAHVAEEGGRGRACLAEHLRNHRSLHRDDPEPVFPQSGEERMALEWQRHQSPGRTRARCSCFCRATSTASLCGAECAGRLLTLSM